jgi:two-component system nitrogen regulation sensor histidine kinase NtrY
MMLRRKLFAVFAITVLVSVTAVAWSISLLARRAFEKANELRTVALVGQFRREFNRRGEEVARRVDAIAASEAATRMALALSHSSPDYSEYLNEARTIAESQQLDFLEFVDGQGTVISSAQWPGKLGYKETAVTVSEIPNSAFLKQEELPDGAGLGLFAIREANLSEKPLFVIGGRRIDKEFLASLELPAETRAMFYQNLGTGFSPQFLIGAAGAVQQADRIAPIIQQLQRQSRDTTTLLRWSSNPADDEIIDAFPLTGQDKKLLGVLLIGNSRRPYVELRQQIRSVALLCGGGGILLAILLSGWAAARVTRPVEQLAQAAREVASGNWKAKANVTSSDELGELAESFNRMTRELLAQREHLVQAERVAAWRELARRLAHELKNPLFPLQLTVENLMRARQQSPQQFEEIFQESSATLLAEIANLKAIISRFSEFSRMPQPQLQKIQLNDIALNVVRLFQSQFRSPDRPPMECKSRLECNGRHA